MAADSWICGGGGSLGSAETCSLCRGSSLSAPFILQLHFTHYFFVDFGCFNSPTVCQAVTRFSTHQR